MQGEVWSHHVAGNLPHELLVGQTWHQIYATSRYQLAHQQLLHLHPCNWLDHQDRTLGYLRK
jgi:hypothetical protein